MVDAHSAACRNFLGHQSLAQYVDDVHRVAVVVAVLDDELVVGTPNLHIGCNRCFYVVVEDVDEDRISEAVGRIDGVGIGIP